MRAGIRTGGSDQAFYQTVRFWSSLDFRSTFTPQRSPPNPGLIVMIKQASNPGHARKAASVESERPPAATGSKQSSLRNKHPFMYSYRHGVYFGRSARARQAVSICVLWTFRSSTLPILSKSVGCSLDSLRVSFGQACEAYVGDRTFRWGLAGVGPEKRGWTVGGGGWILFQQPRDLEPWSSVKALEGLGLGLASGCLPIDARWPAVVHHHLKLGSLVF
ncbi:hypothetical protein B0T22DRAFT_457890 [Podospora appendiculata]|uniref:Uncharacterized protein n=1 Tax=Podospora appendiculata TaxID=314037 RepID=A0AAE1CBR9_9PEZI|nr:hypothetical protein B0T22DRAFT_457890 [Podospora appendiculata]